MNDWLNSLASESIVEDAAITWLESLGYAVQHGSEIAPDIYMRIYRNDT